MTQILRDQPAVYEIHVTGRLDSRWSERFNTLAIATQNNETHLIGRILDQAELFGILNTLHTLGYPLISVSLKTEPALTNS